MILLQLLDDAASLLAPLAFAAAVILIAQALVG